jgi:hypothetical protein
MSRWENAPNLREVIRLMGVMSRRAIWDDRYHAMFVRLA